MNKKNLEKNIRENMPEGLTQLEKARYIYLELGKEKAFDPKYYYGSNNTRRQIIMLAEKNRNHPEKFYDKKNLICVSLSYLYQHLLNKFGVDAKVIANDSFDINHLVPILIINDEERGNLRLRADLQRDLEHIQTGMKTEQFGTIEEYDSLGCDTIDEKELRNIDKKIGYIKDEYRDKDIEDMASEIGNMNANDSLKYILQDERIYKNTNFQGPVERRKYYHGIMKKIVPQYMNKKMYMFSCYRENENKERDYTMCAFSHDNNQIQIYLFSNKEKRFLPVTIDKMIELQESGLNLGTSPKTRGIGILRRAMIKKIDNKNNLMDVTNER